MAVDEGGYLFATLREQLGQMNDALAAFVGFRLVRISNPIVDELEAGWSEPVRLRAVRLNDGTYELQAHRGETEPPA